jgi:hypothetical protein
MGRSPYIWVCERVASRREWHAIPKTRSVPHWSANTSEAQVRAMQAEGLDPTMGPDRWSAAERLRGLNPPAPERDPRD